ncbi:ribosome biogenesis GTP-binding protein YihA/YsxC [Clostridium gasigenes]|uniref:Probable GTP-binding protein EngB n=1 Tax=Clostridium gasigenes TaxID=94869 RepID=A0A1H0S7V5_9CLOT|nr:ribosome biogenesis GTP-binding protein YihA/YsxC [Clostridium gasigenes]MBB6622773.1 YihA family ribosome biogenesis GTP-binding protein [Clostridium gasigenes]MBB6714365.1 YihA family ribosome biogenesis GTP-binding protein [Clostridium gasigenes]MBU3089470.1 ribosome biogenesis GTP-binding protein YihA/YsxC [Clostridium gasigenes]MBU3103701.1 ribosome biogenesis GTP-binding protein YihA/YsxC [Clostridium gasigenes]MBU3108350.1 ribosome biogenesis GTP-binding protein YihA/YsxC [Clostridiu
MRIKQSEFEISAVKREQYPVDGLPEVAFVGRSNVGKSSIINALANRRHLAKVSQTPGKTRLINFFMINEGEFHLVDLPGYGYAKVSKTEQASWGKTIEMYLTDREELKRVILLVDSRHKPTKDDLIMHDWVKHFDIEAIVVATKSDKLSNNELRKSEKIIKDTMGLTKDDKFYFFSSLNKKGKDELINYLFEGLVEEENEIE